MTIKETSSTWCLYFYINIGCFSHNVCMEMNISFLVSGKALNELRSSSDNKCAGAERHIQWPWKSENIVKWAPESSGGEHFLTGSPILLSINIKLLKANTIHSRGCGLSTLQKDHDRSILLWFKEAATTRFSSSASFKKNKIKTRMTEEFKASLQDSKS